MKPQILMVEDSRFFGTLLKQEIETRLGHPVLWAKTYAKAQRLLKEDHGDFFLALLDLNLPDAGSGEIVDLVNTHRIPSIVFTAELSDKVREYIWSKNVADYVLKQGKQDVEYVISVIRRLYHNTTVKILLVDDSRFSREHMANLLKVHRYQTLQATNGEQALAVLKDHPDVHLVITDYNMPGMNGDELTRRIREHHSHDELSIIGISAQGSSFLSAKFIKSGANDFIIKPFISEEFYCRVSQNVQMLMNIRTIREMSNRDYLTDLYNRRHFFETGGKIFAGALRGKSPLALGMIDIDNFKRINDQYGHDVGDIALRKVSGILKGSFRESDVVARFGGEEFCVLITNAQPTDATVPFEKVRSHIAAAEIDLKEETLRVTVSIGVCRQIGKSLEEMISSADQSLYEAKRTGKNRVVTS